MKSWLKVILIVLIGLALVALALLGRIYWWGKPKPEATVVLTLPPTPAEALTVEGLNPPAVKPEWVEKMRAYYAQWEQMPTWLTDDIETKHGQVLLKYWQLPLVSTDVWDNATVILQDGRKFDLKVLYALGVEVNRQVIVLPVVVTATYRQSNIHFAKGDDQLTLGRAFFLTADAPFATPLGLDWNTCPLTSDWCDLGRGIEEQWPGYTGLILRRVLLEDPPKDFILYGLQARPIPAPAPWVSGVVPDLTTWEVNR